MLFTEDLFHFKLDQPKYGIARGYYGKLPLIHDNKRHKTLLNEFFFYCFPKVSSWQSMRDIHVASLDELTELVLHLHYAEVSLSWPCYTRSSNGIQEHDCLPPFLALCASGVLQSVTASSCHLKGQTGFLLLVLQP